MERDKRVQGVLPSGRVRIFADHREAASNVTRHLRGFDIQLVESQLKVGDYIVSDRVGIERKEIRDFLGSIIDQRLFRQMEELRESFESPVLILEGNPELLFMERDMHANTIRGVLSSIAIDHRIPIIWTRNSRESAAQIFWMAFREQNNLKRSVQIRASKKACSVPDLQEYLVAGLPSVNSTLSKRLLQHFGSVRKVFEASAEELMEVEGIGRKKALAIWKLLNCGYGDWHRNRGVRLRSQ
jgi:ERCC4-type nuclease